MKGKVTLALVTGTSRANVDVVLNSAGLGESFPLIVAKDDVRQVKPAPDCYTLALERLGLKPDEAVALEDSPTGIASAKAAGIRTIAVGHRRRAGDWTEGSPFLENLESPSTLLDELGL